MRRWRVLVFLIVLAGVLVQATVPLPDPPGGDEVVCEGSTDPRGKVVLKPLEPNKTYKVKVSYGGKTYTQSVTTDKNGAVGQVTFRVP